MAKFKGVVKQCEVCGVEFKQSQSRAAQGIRTCSLKCGYAIRRVANKVPGVEVRCEHCGKVELLPPSLAATYRFCSRRCLFESPTYKAEQADRVVGINNPMFTGAGRKCVSSTGRTYSRARADVEAAKLARRKAAKINATPAWADRDRIAAVYVEAQRLSELTGNPHEVDHIVPLQSRLVCGLHVEHNLQVIPASINRSKSNRHWPDM